MYSSIDWKNQPLKASIYCIVLLIAVMILHFLVNLIHLLRRKFHQKFLEKSFGAGPKIFDDLTIVHTIKLSRIAEVV